MDIAKSVEFLATYPIWVRGLFVFWVIVSAALLVSLLLSGRIIAGASMDHPSDVQRRLSLQTSLGSEPSRGRNPIPERRSGEIIDARSGASLSTTLALALDRNATALQREHIMGRFDGWEVEVTGSVCDVARMHDPGFHLLIEIADSDRGSRLISASVRPEGEHWVRSLVPKQRIAVRGILRFGSLGISLDDVRPIA